MANDCYLDELKLETHKYKSYTASTKYPHKKTFPLLKHLKSIVYKSTL